MVTIKAFKASLLNGAAADSASSFGLPLGWLELPRVRPPTLSQLHSIRASRSGPELRAFLAECEDEGRVVTVRLDAAQLQAFWEPVGVFHDQVYQGYLLTAEVQVKAAGSSFTFSLEVTAKLARYLDRQALCRPTLDSMGPVPQRHQAAVVTRGGAVISGPSVRSVSLAGWPTRVDDALGRSYSSVEEMIETLSRTSGRLIGLQLV